MPDARFRVGLSLASSEQDANSAGGPASVAQERSGARQTGQAQYVTR